MRNHRVLVVVPVVLATFGAGLTDAATSQAATSSGEPLAASGTTIAATHRLYGWTIGTDGMNWSNVSVTATKVGASSPSASAISYGGFYELWVPAGTYEVKFDDLSDRVPVLSREYDVTVADSESEDICLGREHLTHGTVNNLDKPTITGPARVGESLKANPGTWSPASGLDYDYTWYVGRSTVGHNRSQRIYPAWVGKNIKVAVRAGSLTWTTKTVAADSITVRKALTRIDASRPSTATKVGSAVPVRVRITDRSTGGSVYGIVNVYEGRQRVGQQSINSKDGTGTVKVKGLQVGKHTLKLVWPGDDMKVASTDTVNVRVVR